MTEAGPTQQSSCSDIQLQVMPPNKRRHQSITNNTIIHKPVHTQDFNVRCQCTSNNKIIPTWSYSDGSIITACINQHIEICSTISRRSRNLTFPVLRDKFSEVYKCHAKTVVKFFKLVVFGQYFLLGYIVKVICMQVLPSFNNHNIIEHYW